MIAPVKVARKFLEAQWLPQPTIRMSKEKHLEMLSKALRGIEQTDNVDIGEIQRRIEDQYPLVEDIGIGPRETRFTGDIRKVTVEVKEIK